MKVAVMQPYLFPYLGYYQLVRSVDTFVLYDDVTFIKNSWINRNCILVDGSCARFTVPVPGGSSNKRIKELSFSGEVRKVLKTIGQAYSKAPYFDAVYPIVENVLTHPDRRITSVCSLGVTSIFDYLDMPCDVRRASDLEYDRTGAAGERLASICSALDSAWYVNSIGGKKLYSKKQFEDLGCKLSFLQMEQARYPQGMDEFVPNLSMIDVLMRSSKERLWALLDGYKLI